MVDSDKIHINLTSSVIFYVNIYIFCCPMSSIFRSEQNQKCSNLRQAKKIVRLSSFPCKLGFDSISFLEFLPTEIWILSVTRLRKLDLWNFLLSLWYQGWLLLGISTSFIMMHSFHSAPQWGVEETSLFEAPLAWPMSESSQGCRKLHKFGGDNFAFVCLI